MSKETKIPLSVMIESAKGEIRNTIRNIKTQYNFPATILGGILNSVLTEIQIDEKVEIINETNNIIREKNDEIEQLRKMAKKVLKEQEEQSEV